MSGGTKYKLTYFHLRGRAEAIRFMFKFAKVPFEDYRIAREDWPKVKPTLPIGQAPVLEVTHEDGSKCTLCQSGAITRQLASWFGLAGKSACETARADEACECMKDIGEAASKAFWNPDAEQKAKLFEALNGETIPQNLAYLEKNCKAHGKTNVAGGDSFTYADFRLAVLLEMLRLLSAPSVNWQAIETNYPCLVAVKKAVEESPDIKAYMATREETMF